MNKNYYIAGFDNYNNKNTKFISSFEIKRIRIFYYKFSHNINKGKEAFGSLIC